MTENLFRCVLQPRWHELDGSRVARPRVLMDWMEHARSTVPEDDPVHHAFNYGLARAIRLDTFAPLEAPAPVSVAVWLSHCGTTSYTIDHELTRADDALLLARGRGLAYFTVSIVPLLVFMAMTVLLLPHFGIEASGIAFAAMTAVHLALGLTLGRISAGWTAWTRATALHFAALLAVTLGVFLAARQSDLLGAIAGTALALSLDADNTWASMSSAIDLNLQLGANALRLTSTGLAGDTPALGVLAGQTRLANGTVHADAGDVRVGSGNSGASLVLDNGAQLLMANTNLGKVFVATGGAGRDGLLRLDHGAVLRTDQVHLGSLLAAGSGRLELSGSGSQVDTSLLNVGGNANGANGSVLVDKGAMLRTQALTLARHANATGELTVDGVGSQLSLRGGAVNIGSLANGRVVVSGGGALLGEDATVITVGNADVTLNSLLRVEGSGSRMGNVGIQVLASGTLELRDGARWDAASIQGVNALAIQAGTVRFDKATVTLVDATLESLATQSLNPDGTTHVNVTKTGLWDIGNGSTVTVSSLVTVDLASQLRVHDSGTRFSGFSDMALNGTLSVFNGADLSGSLIALGPHGQIGGNLGHIHADVMGTDGRITPGQSPGLLEIDGNVTLGGQAALELEIAGTSAGISYDVLQVSGNLQMTGGRVVLKFLDGFAPRAGDVFDLLQVGGTLSLDGSTVVEVQGLKAGWQYDLQSGGGHGLRLLSINQGASAVPEPAAWMVGLLGLAGIGVARRWRLRRDG